MLDSALTACQVLRQKSLILGRADAVAAGANKALSDYGFKIRVRYEDEKWWVCFGGRILAVVGKNPEKDELMLNPNPNRLSS